MPSEKALEWVKKRAAQSWVWLRAELRSPRFLIVASYALLTLVFRAGAVLQPGRRVWGQGQDIWIALWDAWWFERVVHDGEWPLRTPYLFYPNGVDLTYHSISWTSVAVAIRCARSSERLPGTT